MRGLPIRGWRLTFIRTPTEIPVIGPGDAADTHRPCPSEVQVRSLQRVFEQSNFHDMRVLRINEAPAIEIHAAASSEALAGMGKPGTSCLAPAVTDAISRPRASGSATCRWIRRQGGEGQVAGAVALFTMRCVLQASSCRRQSGSSSQTIIPQGGLLNAPDPGPARRREQRSRSPSAFGSSSSRAQRATPRTERAGSLSNP